MGLNWSPNARCIWSWICLNCRTKDRFVMMFWKRNFTFTTEEAGICIQINLLTICLKCGGQLWALEDYWTQVGVATGHSASIADFNWSPARIFVSNFAFL